MIQAVLLVPTLATAELDPSPVFFVWPSTLKYSFVKDLSHAG